MYYNHIESLIRSMIERNYNNEFSGIINRSILLIIASIVFAPSHIMISYKNVKWYLQIPVWQKVGDDDRMRIL